MNTRQVWAATAALVAVVFALVLASDGVASATGTSPLLAAAGLVAGAFYTAVCAVRPKSAVAIILAVAISVRTLERFYPGSSVGYLDEVLILVLAAMTVASTFLRRRRFRTLPGQWAFVLVAILGLASAFAASVPATTASQGAFLMLKTLLFGWSIAQIDWQVRDVLLAAKMGAVAVLVLLGGAVINVIAPEFWSTSIMRGYQATTRLGYTPPTSFFVHPGYYATFLSFACIAAYAYRVTIRRTAASMVVLIGSFLGVFASIRRRSILALITALVTLRLAASKSQTILIVVLAVPIVAVLAADSVRSIVDYTYDEYFVDSAQVARVRLYLDAPALALSHFPLGSGFGTFGSAVARDNYSPIYVALGYPSIYGLAPESNYFLTDTFWPAVLGETGFLGLLAYAVGIVAIIRAAKRLTLADLGAHKFLGTVVLGWSIAMVIESVAAAVYTEMPTGAMFFAAVGIMTAVISQQNLTDASPSGITRPRSQARRRSGGKRGNPLGHSR